MAGLCSLGSGQPSPFTAGPCTQRRIVIVAMRRRVWVGRGVRSSAAWPISDLIRTVVSFPARCVVKVRRTLLRSAVLDPPTFPAGGPPSLPDNKPSPCTGEIHGTQTVALCSCDDSPDTKLQRVDLTWSFPLYFSIEIAFCCIVFCRRYAFFSVTFHGLAGG